MEVDIIVTIALATAAIVFVNQVSRMIRARMFHRTVRDALSRNSDLTPELLDRIEEREPQSGGDSRIGLVLLALGLALFCYGLIQGDADDIRNLAGIAIFPIFVSAALLGRVWYLRRRGEVS